MNKDLIKMLAMLTMLLNHIAHVCLVEDSLLYTVFVDIGYFTAITMIYFLIEGKQYTRDIKKYEQRLLIYGIISQIPFTYAFSSGNKLSFVGLNMMFTLYFCLKIIELDAEEETTKSKVMTMVYYLLCCFSDWQYMAPLFTMFLLNAKKEKWTYPQAYGGCFALFYASELLMGKGILGSVYALIPLVVSALVIRYLYNGKRATVGRKFYQYFFYSFYPVHLIILCLIKLHNYGMFL